MQIVNPLETGVLITNYIQLFVHETLLSVTRNTSSSFSCNFEANASELQDKFEEILPC